MGITLEQAKKLDYGDVLHATSDKNADGTPVRFRVNGKPKTWKRDHTRIKVPLKHGLYDYGELTNGTFEGNQFILYLDMVNLGDGLSE